MTTNASINATIENTLILCMSTLRGRCDGAKELDGVGFDKIDASGDFIRSLEERADKGIPFTGKQLAALHRTLIRYKNQLASIGLTLPEKAEVDALVDQRLSNPPNNPVTPTYQHPTHPTLDVQDNLIRLYVPYAQKYTLDQLRGEYSTLASQGKQGFSYGGFRWGGNDIETNPKKEWTIFLHENAFNLIIKHFGNGIEYMPSASAYKMQMEEQVAQALVQKKQESEAAKREYFALLSQINNCKGEIAPGKALFNHQPAAIKLALWMYVKKKGCIIGDDMGLGKTFEGLVTAKALYMQYGYHVYVVTTQKMQRDWLRTANELRMPIEVYTWGKLPKPHAEVDPFIVLFDEAHNAQNMSAQRTKDMLAVSFHSKCKFVCHLTGTPIPNGRPLNMYAMLLSAKHNLVWHPDAQERRKLRKKYEEMFCFAGQKYIGRKLDPVDGVRKDMYVRDLTGSNNLIAFNRLVMYVPGRENNHSDACCIQRLKKDCTDLPEKLRKMQEADVSRTDAQTFDNQVSDIFARFEKRAAEKVAQFIAEYKAEHEEKNPSPEDIAETRAEVYRAEAIVRYNAFRHAGAMAKASTAVEMALEIMENDNKVVLYTTFQDAADHIAAKIEKETGTPCHVISGKAKVDEVDQWIKDFQDDNGASKAVVIMAAGGEGITLTAASYMIVVDRPWTPGRTKQAEDRIHRFGQKSKVMIYWLQLPAEICEVDNAIDGIIETKELNINTALQGVRKALDFTEEIDSVAERILQKTYQRIKRQQKKIS